MGNVNAQFDKVMRMLANERAQRLATEERLRQAEAQIEAASCQKAATCRTHRPLMLAPLPRPLLRPPAALTCGALAENFVIQIGLHTLTYPEQFRDDSSKVAFAISFLTDYAATWAQPYTTKLFAGMPVAFLEFLNDFKAIFFDLNCKHQAKVALQSIRQTGTVAAYTQAFNMHACALEWSESTLMSLYQQGLKEKVQLAILMSNVAFNRLPAMQEMALRAGNTLEAIRSGHPNPIPSGTSSLAPDPNTMDL
ncbi:hypothetical protein PCASD_26919 [Puccinia coronata f. sp. avenae]|uniref:Retrotransposon gag domain-containing protein n=1 Tax=Puccinia coronata f. sp. avenae TaxID=200324 RepID=A0A2N5RUD3_9BASI|nr:hypothetical protein PCASD_26919 [Puccinia coronata f. sp. avenae]